MVSLRQVRDALDAVGCAPEGWRPARLGLRREARRRVDLAEATAAVRLLQAGLLRAAGLRATGRWPERGDDHLERACRLASDALARWPATSSATRARPCAGSTPTACAAVGAAARLTAAARPATSTDACMAATGHATSGRTPRSGGCADARHVVAWVSFVVS